MDCRKELFSLPAGLHYLNHAYMSPLSRQVAAAGQAAIRRLSNPSEIGPEDFFRDCNEVRRLFARLINASDPLRVAIIPATSYGFSQVARNTPLAKGQTVVMVGQEFPSNYYVWKRACDQSGARLRQILSPRQDSSREAAWNDAIVEAIDRETAVVTLSSVHWTDGTLFDLERIGSRAREVGAAFLVDGSQSVGALPFDVQRVRPDALICASYKWLTALYSISVAYFGERYDGGVPIEETWLVREGSDDFAGLANYTERYRAGAIRYDVGETSNFVLVPMLVAALRQVLDWGDGAVAEYATALTRDLVGEARSRGFTVADDRWRSDHLFGLRMPEGTDAEQLRARLQEKRIHVAVRGDAVRISAHLYNDDADVRALRDALMS
jgi:selenocysteine lyase/cysteine desulfurase